MNPFIIVSPATRGLSLALTRHLLRSTNLPVYATHRSEIPDEIRQRILSPLNDVDHSRLHLLHLDLTSEDSIAYGAQCLKDTLPADKKSYIDTAFFTGGVLHPEKQPSDLDAASIQETFQINVISHLLQIKHFSQFLPRLSTGTKGNLDTLAKWVHITARVGSVSDNKRGGWYSYRASKAALNQVVKTFDLQLQMQKTQAMCVGVHPGTVKTDLSKGFWHGVEKDKLFEPEDAAAKVIDVVEKLKEKQRGRLWDWAGNEVHP